MISTTSSFWRTGSRSRCSRAAKRISQMIAERAGQNFSLLILDEVLGSLDETRRFNVVELLRGLQDRFEQVILITHIESVREGLDRLITVGYDPATGQSVVRQEKGGSEIGAEVLAEEQAVPTDSSTEQGAAA